MSHDTVSNTGCYHTKIFKRLLNERQQGHAAKNYDNHSYLAAGVVSSSLAMGQTSQNWFYNHPSHSYSTKLLAHHKKRTNYAFRKSQNIHQFHLQSNPGISECQDLTVFCS
jgi:hypothetical protein